MFDNGSGQVAIDPANIVTANDTDTLLDAAIAGIGVAYLGELLASDVVASGTLVQLLPEWTSPFSGFYLYHPGRRLMPPPLRAFINHLKISAVKTVAIF